MATVNGHLVTATGQRSATAAEVARMSSRQGRRPPSLRVRPFWQELRVELHTDGISVAALDDRVAPRAAAVGRTRDRAGEVAFAQPAAVAA